LYAFGENFILQQVAQGNDDSLTWNNNTIISETTPLYDLDGNMNSFILNLTTNGSQTGQLITLLSRGATVYSIDCGPISGMSVIYYLGQTLGYSNLIKNSSVQNFNTLRSDMKTAENYGTTNANLETGLYNYCKRLGYLGGYDSIAAYADTTIFRSKIEAWIQHKYQLVVTFEKGSQFGVHGTFEFGWKMVSNLTSSQFYLRIYDANGSGTAMFYDTAKGYIDTVIEFHL
jgi:hypothetical protein